MMYELTSFVNPGGLYADLFFLSLPVRSVLSPFSVSLNHVIIVTSA